MKYSCWAAGRPVCLSPAPTGVCSGTRRQVKLSELSAAAVLIFSFKVDSCFNDSCCSCCLSRCQTVSLSLHVYEAKNMTQIKNKIRNKTNPSAVARMCTFAELLSVSVRLCAVRLLGWIKRLQHNRTGLDSEESDPARRDLRLTRNEPVSSHRVLILSPSSNPEIAFNPLENERIICSSLCSCAISNSSWMN